MLLRLDYDDEKKTAEQARTELDVKLKVKRWRVTPEAEDPYSEAEVDEGAPWWWDGDEEASQTFLASQGVKLGGDRSNGGSR